MSGAGTGTAPPKRKPKLRAFAYGVFWLFLIAMFAGLTVTQAARYMAAQAELERAQADLAAEQRIHRQLLNDAALYESDAYIEQLARDQLGYVMPDEIVFVNEP